MNENLINNLKLLMNGDSNRKFATRCELSEGAIRNLLKGGEWDSKTLKKISNAYNVSIILLLSKNERECCEKIPAADDSLERNGFRSLCVKNLEVVFEFIGEKYGKDALGIQIFLDAMQEEFHDYRAWRHEKLMERISEEKKQAVGGAEDIPQKLVSGKKVT